MGSIHIRELTGGLDARRLPETTPGGVLVRADNGHITRGGEFEARAAFVPEFELPSGTVGLAHTPSGLIVFGSGTRPSGLSPFIRYQRLQKDGRELARIRDWELFDGRIYAVAEFSDGTIAHFYDGTEVTAWQDARAFVRLQVDSGMVTPAAQASATFRVTGGTGEIINAVTSIRVAGTEILQGSIIHTGNNATTAALIAERINANPTTPGYSAESSGNTITLTAEREGTAANGRTITWEVTGDFSLGNATAFSGGANEVVPRLNNLTIGGTRVLRGPVPWAGSTVATAAAIADAINELASDPEYIAIANGNSVTIHTEESGADQNGRALVANITGNMSVSTPDGGETAGGADLDNNRYLPGVVALTVQSKLYVGSGTNLHYSAVGNPRYWTPGGADPNEIGAGFTNTSTASSAGAIVALARYFDKLAVFTSDSVQTWFLDPNPDLVVQSQVLENTGTVCPGSVTQFGDADIFYLDTSGLRSLRARDSSNAAASTDVGVPIDDILAERVAAMNTAERQRVIGLINPADKRFWLIMGSEIFVYSFFPNSKVNAWTRYEAVSTVGVEREVLDIEAAVGFGRRVFLRSGDTIYCYGGIGREEIYDDTPAVVWLPMLDADAPTARKPWRGIDAALVGKWEIGASFDPNLPNERDTIARVTETTFAMRQIKVNHSSTHCGLRFTSAGGPARLSAVVIHFSGKLEDA